MTDGNLVSSLQTRHAFAFILSRPRPRLTADTHRAAVLYSVQPLDRATLVRCGRATRNQMMTVEDQYAGGGIGDAVAEAVAAEGIVVHRLAVREIPRSGKPEEMLEKFGVGAKQIVEICQSLGAGGSRAAEQAVSSGGTLPSSSG